MTIDDPVLTILDGVEPWMSFYFEAKSELNTCADMHGVIPWTAILSYAQTYGLDVEQFDDFKRIIRSMEEGVRKAREELNDSKESKSDQSSD